MDKITLAEFIEDLSSNSPAPGGGAMSALLGVLGCSMTSMVCALTEGKKKYTEFEEDVKNGRAQIIKLQSELYELIEKDKCAFQGISNAYQLPKDTEEEKAQRSKAIQAALKPATEVPFLMMKLAHEALLITKDLLPKTNKFVISDMGCAALGLKSAVEGAWLNVMINISSSKNKPVEIEEEGKKILKDSIETANEIYNTALNNL